jgi:hypothetical protein
MNDLGYRIIDLFYHKIIGSLRQWNFIKRKNIYKRGQKGNVLEGLARGVAQITKLLAKIRGRISGPPSFYRKKENVSVKTKMTMIKELELHYQKWDRSHASKCSN